MKQSTFIVLAFAVWIAAAACILTMDQDREIERYFADQSFITTTK